MWSWLNPGASTCHLSINSACRGLVDNQHNWCAGLQLLPLPIGLVHDQALMVLLQPWVPTVFM